ncbi:hypothetical protein HYW84_02810 [Candidatus Peregrinibacteria bacterium]|nr:hypothetical protein [Candidatus Peregrinibacteria bacterium]
MTIAHKILSALGFILILLALGTADYLITRDSIKFLPAQEGTAKHIGPDVVAVAAAHGFAVTDTTERNILPAVLPVASRGTFFPRVLLKDNDRAATIGWIDSSDVKMIFTMLRKHLRQSFSPSLADLIDETQSQAGKPPRDVLSFRDSGIMEERAVFVRIKERIYELHVKEGFERDMNRLIDALTE